MTVLASDYQARLIAVRAAMRTRGLEALIVYSWKRGQVRYLTGYRPNYIANVAAALLPLVGDATLFIRFPFDLERARRACWFDDVRASGDVPGIGRDIVDWLKAHGLAEAKVGLGAGDMVMDEWPHSLHQQIAAALPHLQFDDARDLLMALREVKSSAELDCLRASARVTDLAIAAARDRIRPGITESQIVAEAEHTARGAAAEEWLVAITTRGSRDLVHTPGAGAAESGEVVVLEVATQVGGYWTQAARTFAVGEVSAAQQKIFAATHAAYRAAVEAAQVGRSLCDIQSSVNSILSPAGFMEYAEHDTGHGIGLDLPEPPRVDIEGDAQIKPGLVLVLHPAVRVPGVGGAFLGGTILVTEHGPEPLHFIPETL
jgi:Xaa-Pro dipeptidase